MALLWTVGWAQAHPMPETRVWLDTRADGLNLTLDVPLNRLGFAFGQVLADRPDEVLPSHEAALRAYLLAHVHAWSLDGTQPWTAEVTQLRVLGHDANAELQAVLSLRAPTGADPRALRLRHDLVTHAVRTHRAQFFLRNDWAAGLAGGVPTPLALADAAHTEFRLKLGAPRAGGGVWASMGALMWAGALHIAQGADHLLFLSLLLWVAPLVAQGGQWAQARPGPQAWRQAAWIVTAFTLGHTVTLVLGSLGLVRPPEQWVEVAVAASILIAALHAARPLWHRAELAMGLGFGLVHGLAFSASLSGAGLSPWQHGLALLAFNLGIELTQLLLLALILPAMLALLRHRPQAHASLRRAMAVLGGLMALWWMGERLGLF